jgi:hypothetical protein
MEPWSKLLLLGRLFRGLLLLLLRRILRTLVAHGIAPFTDIPGIFIAPAGALYYIMLLEILLDF